MKLEPKTIRKISIVLYMLSLIPPAYCVKGDCGDYFGGFFAIIFGPVGLLAGGPFLTWLANPFLWVAWRFYNKNIKTALIFSTLALLVGLSFMLHDKIMINEAGNYGNITGYALGYWLWIGSMLMMFVGSILLYKQSKENEIL